MQLTYTYKIQDKTSRSTVNITDIDITVEYTPETGAEIIDVYAKDKLYGGTGRVDIGRFLVDVLNLESKIDDIADWYALYHQELQNEKELKELREEEELWS